MSEAGLLGIFTDEDRRAWSPNRRAASAAIISSARLRLSHPRGRRVGSVITVVACAALVVAGGAWWTSRWSSAPKIVSVGQLRPPPVQPGVVPVSSIKAAPTPIRAAPAYPAAISLPMEQEHALQRPARQRSRLKAAPRRNLPSAADPCPGLHGAGRARCLHPAVLAADAALRRAYTEAEAAGVPRATLAPVRDRWAEVNSHFTDDPDYMIANLRSLAKGLRGLRRADRQAR